MQKFQLLCKYVQNQITTLKQQLLNDYLVKSKYSKVLETALYQQNYIVFWVRKEGVSTPKPPTPLGALPAPSE